MKKLLNTLFITTPDAYLACENSNVTVIIDSKPKFSIPIHTLESIISFGYSGASPALMRLCLKNNVGLTFCSEHGKFLGRVTGEINGNVVLRKMQYLFSTDETKSLKLAKSFVKAKIFNSRVVVNRALRDSKDKNEKLGLISKTLYKKIKSTDEAGNLAELLGVEGEAARVYFSSFNDLITNNNKDFYIEKRTKRPPLDRFNALLSFLYTLLFNDVQTAIESVGMDSYLGFYHQDLSGRASLACDIMEEFRAPFADRMALSLVNRRQINKNDFLIKENGAVILKDDARKELLAAWHKRKQEFITHPFLNEKIKTGLLPYSQALLLARYLRGDLQEYPAFHWR